MFGVLNRIWEKIQVKQDSDNIELSCDLEKAIIELRGSECCFNLA
jgi:hypothetical protein